MLFCITFVICPCTLSREPLIVTASPDISNTLAGVPVSASSSSEMVWEASYGGAGDDRAFCMASADGGFLIAGSSTSFILNKIVAWAVRTDSNGGMIWNRIYQESGECEFRNVVKLDDGFVLAGNVFSSTGDEDACIVRIDEQGNVLWNKTFGGEKLDKIFSIAPAPNGFILAGLTHSSGSDNSDAWLIKTDMEGRLTWSVALETSGGEAFRSALAARTGGYVAAGYTDSIGDGIYDFWLVKTDEEGRIQWNQTYGHGESDKAYGLADSEDGYLIVGETHSDEKTDADALVVKTDVHGKLMWEKTCGGGHFDDVNTIMRARNGYAAVGFTFSYGEGQRDIWSFKIDDVGNIVWMQSYGRQAFEEAYAVIEVGNDEFVIGGWTNSIGHGGYDFYLVRVK